MKMEKYFESVIEFEKLLNQSASDDAEKEKLKQMILSHPYLKRVRSFQNLYSIDSDREVSSEQKQNSIRDKYFFNPAVPSRKNGKKNKNPILSGYHKHNYYEFIFVLKGTYVQYVNGVKYIHEEGDICLLTPNIVHCEEVQDEDERVLFCGISRELFEKELMRALETKVKLLVESINNTSFSHQFLVFHCQNNEKVRNYLLEIMKEDMEKEIGHHMVIKGYMARLIYEMAHNEAWEYVKLSKEEAKSNLLKEMLEYMEKNMTTVTKNEMAAYFHFNPDYLGRFFLKMTGTTYSEYLKEMKLEKAAEMLRTGKSVNTVINELGYVNKGYFNKIFKEAYGVLPGEYKKEHL